MSKSKIDRPWFNQLHEAVKTEGSYEPKRVIPHFEEYLTQGESEEVRNFLTWLVDNKRAFGWNLPDVFYEYLVETGQADGGRKHGR